LAFLRPSVLLYLLCHSIDVLRLPLEILDIACAVLIVLLGLARALFVLLGDFLDLTGVRQDELIVFLE
jgi:multisubunit Na+/H+ antiporter MnhB subunit